MSTRAFELGRSACRSLREIRINSSARGLAMSDSLRAGRVGLALLLSLLLQRQSVLAKDLVSNKYGFQLSIPTGFREQSVDVHAIQYMRRLFAKLDLIIEYVETAPTRGSYPI